MTDFTITYENNIFYCTKNNTKWISVDGEKWYGEEKRITELERKNRLLGERCNQLLKDKGDLTDRLDQLQEQNSQMFNTIALQEQQIEKMKADVKQEQSYWNSGEMQYGLFQRLLDKWETKEND